MTRENAQLSFLFLILSDPRSSGLAAVYSVDSGSRCWLDSLLTYWRRKYFWHKSYFHQCFDFEPHRTYGFLRRFWLNLSLHPDVHWPYVAWIRSPASTLINLASVQFGQITSGNMLLPRANGWPAGSGRMQFAKKACEKRLVSLLFALSFLVQNVHLGNCRVLWWLFREIKK